MFLTAGLLGRVAVNLKEYSPSPNKFWRKQQWLRFANKRFGRQRTCFSIAVRAVNKGMMKSTIARQEKKIVQKALWESRIDAAAAEHHLQSHEIMEALSRCQIQLDRKMLSEIAIYEPRTFQSLTEICKQKLEQEGLKDPVTPSAKNVITQGML